MSEVIALQGAVAEAVAQLLDLPVDGLRPRVERHDGVELAAPAEAGQGLLVGDSGVVVGPSHVQAGQDLVRPPGRVVDAPRDRPGCVTVRGRTAGGLGRLDRPLTSMEARLP